MSKILKTKLLTFDKSSFDIDLIANENGSKYVEILQRIHSEKFNGNSIKISPSALIEIVNVLIEFNETILAKPTEKTPYLSAIKQVNLQERYLKGISLKDLTLQFDLSEKDLEKILKSRGIVIAKPEPFKRRRTRK